jgi:hypothetical protein
MTVYVNKEAFNLRDKLKLIEGKKVFDSITVTSINGLTVGKGNNNIDTNTAIGVGVLQANSTGSSNAANGYEALYSNTTGINNTANGYRALYLNTTASYNTANGYQALRSNTTGNSNTANGYQALLSNTTGNSNTANGYQALYYNTTGSSNTANGWGALISNTTGTYNTANGYRALYSNTTALYNTATGHQALFSNTTGASNTANGLQALYYNTTGSSNTATGVNALFYNTTGLNNTAIGYRALISNTTSSENTALGQDALYTNSTGGNNIALGFMALYSATTAANNTAIGHQAGYLITTGAKNTILGRFNGNQGGLDIRTANNHIVLSDGDGNPRVVVDGAGNTQILSGSTWAPSLGGTCLSHNSSNAYLTTYYDATSVTIGAGVTSKNKITVSGTGQNNNITFDVNANERMRITSAGNVGIGTSAPSTLLHLSSFSPRITLTDTDTGADHRINADSSVGNLAFDVDVNSETASPVLVVNIKGSERFRITSAGNVGIGTSAPAALVDVRKDNTIQYDSTDDAAQQSNTATIHVINNTETSGTFAQLAFTTSLTNRAMARIVAVRTGSSSNDLAFCVEGSNVKQEVLRITGGGNVGIGTTTPGSKLAVNGTITESTDGTNYYPVVTQQDIGTEPNEIPLNQNLGNLAYQDAENIAGDVNIGGTITATAFVGDGSGLTGGPAFSTAFTGTAAASGTHTEMTTNTEHFDTHSALSTSTGRFQPSVSGYYQVNISLRTDTGTPLGFAAAIIINSSTSNIRGAAASSISDSGAYKVESTSALIYLNGSTDWVSAYAYCYSGTATVSGNFSGCFIRG